MIWIPLYLAAVAVGIFEYFYVAEPFIDCLEKLLIKR